MSAYTFDNKTNTLSFNFDEIDAGYSGAKFFSDLYRNNNFCDYPKESEIRKDLMIEMETFVGTKKQIEEKENEIIQEAKRVYKIKQGIYGKIQGDIEDAFKNWLFKDLGIENNIRKEKLYSMAYERGHSSGYSEVYSEANSLVDLIN